MNIGRPLEFNPDQALETAMQQFWSKGYESTSLQDLLNVMCLSKSSFYQTFKSKNQLFQRSIKNYQKMLTDDLLTQLDQANSGKAFLETLFMNVANETSGKNARRGCLLMNTASEFAQSDVDIAKLVSNSLDDIFSIFEKAILQAQHEGDIDKSSNAQDLAIYLVTNMSGLKNMVKAGADDKTIKRTVKIILATLN